MKSHLHPIGTISDEELEYYGNKYVTEKINEVEAIPFEHYAQREIMLKNRLSKKSPLL